MNEAAALRAPTCSYVWAECDKYGLNILADTEEDQRLGGSVDCGRDIGCERGLFLTQVGLDDVDECLPEILGQGYYAHDLGREALVGSNAIDVGNSIDVGNLIVVGDYVVIGHLFVVECIHMLIVLFLFAKLRNLMEE